MNNKLQNFKERFINNFIMSKDIKRIVVERNLKMLLKVSSFLGIFCMIMFIMSYTTIDYHEENVVDYLFYYLSMVIINIFSFVLSYIFLKVKKIKIWLYNLPVILNFIGLEINCYIIFTYGSNPFNSLIIFVCLATLLPLMYAIEPMYYIITLIVNGVLMTPKMIELYGITTANNSTVYLFIMSSLAMSRWFYVKRNFEHNKKTEEWEKQIEQELDMASLVQKSLYTHDLTGIKDWNVAYYNDPMISLSGDLFDFFIRQNTLSGLCIFDVSGHGLASGLVTMMVKNTMEEEFYDNEDIELDFTMQRINKRVREEKGNIENYLTGILLRLSNDKIEMINAGHPNPIVYHASTNQCEYFKCDIKDRQGAIGLTDIDYLFTTLELNMEKNDRIILYTDGVTEAKNSLSKEYGKNRFLESAQKHCNLTVEDEIKALTEDIKLFIGKSPRTDDISIIILEKK